MPFVSAFYHPLRCSFRRFLPCRINQNRFPSEDVGRNPNIHPKGDTQLTVSPYYKKGYMPVFFKHKFKGVEVKYDGW